MRLPLIAASLIATAAIATTPVIAAPTPAPATITVEMAHRGFHPQVIRLKSGRPYRLTFINRDGTTHDFFAPRLLNAAQIDMREGRKLDDGRLNVPPRSTRSFVLTPMRPGPYEAKSSKAIDAVSNMTAQVLVY